VQRISHVADSISNPASLSTRYSVARRVKRRKAEALRRPALVAVGLPAEDGRRRRLPAGPALSF
jgi:hypothetical protein